MSWLSFPGYRISSLFIYFWGFIIILIYLVFNWRVIALQNFVVFSQTSTRISHRYTYIPSLLNLLPISLPIPCLWVDTEPFFVFPETYSKLPLAIYFTYGRVYSGSWWWTGRPGVLQFMGLQRIRDDWATGLNWTECKFSGYSLHISHPLLPSPHVHKPLLYVYFSTAFLQINLLVPSF